MINYLVMTVCCLAMTGLYRCSAGPAKATKDQRSGASGAGSTSASGSTEADAVGAAADPSSATQDTPGARKLFDHSEFLTNCSQCHEPNRPAPVNGVVHGDGASCEQCHTYDPDKKWTAVALTTFTHDPMPTTCITCHAKDRPAPPHDASGDCVTCHTHPDWAAVSGFSHDPKPATCIECHPRPTTVGLRAYPNQGPPAGFNANDPAALGSGHYVGKDCVSCHGTPPEGATAWVFSHSKPNPGICLPCHLNTGRGEHANDGRALLTGLGDCQRCHPNFDRNTARNWRRN